MCHIGHSLLGYSQVIKNFEIKVAVMINLINFTHIIWVKLLQCSLHALMKGQRNQSFQIYQSHFFHLMNLESV